MDKYDSAYKYAKYKHLYASGGSSEPSPKVMKGEPSVVTVSSDYLVRAKDEDSQESKDLEVHDFFKSCVKSSSIDSDGVPYMHGDNRDHSFQPVDFIHTMRAYIERARNSAHADTRPLPVQELQSLRLEKYTFPEGSRIAVVGDIHGGLCNLRNFIHRLRNSGFFTDPKEGCTLQPDHYIVSLGDLVDRGPNSLEVVHLILSLKVNNWEQVHIVNGNHEDAPVYNQYGFISGNLTQIEGVRKVTGEELFRKATTGDHFFFVPFGYLPAAVFIRLGEAARWVQCCHGGIDEDILLKLGKFLEKSDRDHCMIESDAVHSGLKWSDFRDEHSCRSFSEEEKTSSDVKLGGGSHRCGHSSSRGPGSYEYGRSCTDTYLDQLNLECIVRGHQDMVNGFMALPRRHKLLEKAGRVKCTAYIYPIGKGENAACHETYEHLHRSTDTFTTENGNKKPVEWDNMKMCAIPGRGHSSDQKRYTMCVPKDRCKVFQDMFHADIQKNRIYKE